MKRSTVVCGVLAALALSGTVAVVVDGPDAAVRVAQSASERPRADVDEALRLRGYERASRGKERINLAARKTAAQKARKEKARKDAAVRKKAAAMAAKRAAAASAAADTHTAHAPGACNANCQLGRQMAAGYGWGAGAQWSCLKALWTRESGWQVGADNPGSDAYGIPQALPGSKMGSGWQTSARVQIRWGLGYIKGRWGTPCSADAHQRATAWY